MYSSHTALVARDSECKYNVVCQYNISTTATIEVRAFCNNNNNNNNKSDLIKY